jgi:type IX secretion system substrate protein
VGSPEPKALISFALHPNPARRQATLSFDLENEAVVTVTVHDLAGREVARPIVNEVFPAGQAARLWQPDMLSTGIYFLKARIGAGVETRRLVWLGDK